MAICKVFVRLHIIFLDFVIFSLFISSLLHIRMDSSVIPLLQGYTIHFQQEIIKKHISYQLLIYFSIMFDSLNNSNLFEGLLEGSQKPLTLNMNAYL